MFYKKYTPHPLLHPFIECYYIWENKRLSGAGQGLSGMEIESPPSGFGSIVFNPGTPYSVKTRLSDHIEGVPAAFITGQSTRQYRLYLSDSIDMVGVVFKPAGISSLFGLPMIEFADERISLDDVLGPVGRQLQEQISLALSYDERIAVIERFLLFQLIKKDITPDRIDHTANLIVQQRGIVNLDIIAEASFLSRRQFERRFLQRVGVSPKYYARIRRVGYLCSLLAGQRWLVQDWHDLIYRCGYYDQSHFIREFTEFTGKAPSLYLKANTELANYLRT